MSQHAPQPPPPWAAAIEQTDFRVLARSLASHPIATTLLAMFFIAYATNHSVSADRIEPNQECQRQKCNEQANQSSPDCEAVLCDFSHSDGEVVLCVPKSGSSCRLIATNVPQPCHGACAGFPSRSCSVSWNKCELP
jgi:hypothetical protein